MSTLLKSRRKTATTAAPGVRTTPRSLTRDEMVAEALGCIISGRAIPEYLRMASHETARPATVKAGIRRILEGPGSV
jgi:hypothetical protein